MMRYVEFVLGMWLVVLVIWRASGVKLRWRPLHITVGVMILLTVVFDNALVAMDTFRYVPEHISGWLIGRAPIEDLGYAVAAAVLLPALWEWWRKC
ncbi:MAG TPA: lycopene cyclase domain-containing protein [Candidatus Saccharimonadia bacterium]